MLVVLPLLALAGLVLAVLSVRAGRRDGTDEPVLRESLLVATVLWTAVALLSAEALSLPRALERRWLALTWLAVAALAGVVAYRRRAHLARLWSSLRRPALAVPDRLLVGATAVILAVSLFSALVGVGAQDVLTYHLPRAVHWAQNGSLAHFPTPDARQLYHPPLTEIVDLHLLVLSRNDRWVGAAHWWAMLGCVVGVSLIARALGGERRVQLGAATATAALPQLILQTGQGKNDVVAALFLACLAWQCVEASTAPAGRRAAWLAPVALGLAMATKLTAYFWAFPFALWYALAALRRLRLEAWRPLALLVLCPLVLNAGHFARNLDLYGHPLAPPGRQASLGVERPGPAALVSNALRNASVNLGTPSASVNEGLRSAIAGAHRVLGLDVDDPATTWAGRFEVHPASTHIARSGNPLHFLLLGAAAVALVASARHRRNRALVAYVLALACSAGLFVAFVKWQLGIGRLQLPGFVLACAPLAVALSGRRPTGAPFLALALGSLPWLLHAKAAPLLGADSILQHQRWQLWYGENTKLCASAGRAAGVIAEHGYRDIGLLALDSPLMEYPLWRTLDTLAGPVRLEHVGVTGPSAVLAGRAPYAGFRPEVVLAVLGAPGTNGDELEPDFPPFVELGDRHYHEVLRLPRIALYVPR